MGVRLYSRLPKNREENGLFWARDDNGLALIPEVRCRGEADNANAAQANNVIEDPTRVGGDHPAGVYHITKAVSFHASDAVHFASYGPWFFLLDPIGGEALQAKINGRTGLGLHGGALGVGMSLRATFGCLRLDNMTVIHLASLIVPLPPREALTYHCEVAA